MKKNWHDLTFFDAPKEDPYDDWQAVPEAHDLSGAAAAHYFGRILRAPVEFLHTPLDVVDVPEAPGMGAHEPTPPEERMTGYEMLAQGGREMGETGYFGAEGSAEDPWVGQDLTPEILETLLPLAAEIAAYPTGMKVMGEGAMQLVTGIEEVLGAAARGYEKMAGPIAEAYRTARLPGRLAKSQERLTSLGEEAMRGVEWWKNVNEAEKLNMLDEAERQISHALKWTESSMAAEDEMAMNLAIEGRPAHQRVPRPDAPGGPAVEGEPLGIDRLGPGADARVEGRTGADYTSGRYGPFPEPTPATMERISTHEPLEIPGLEPTDPYAYMGETTARKLAVINQRRRVTIQAGMNRAKMRASVEQKELLNELEAAGVDFAEADRELSVEADRFDRLKKRFEENMRAGIPPKLVTEIHDRRIPAILRDPSYRVKTITPKHIEKEMQSIQSAMAKDRRVKDVRLVGSLAEAGGSTKDIDILIELHDKVGVKHIESYTVPLNWSGEGQDAYASLHKRFEEIGWTGGQVSEPIDVFVKHRGKTYHTRGGDAFEAIDTGLEDSIFIGRGLEQETGEVSKYIYDSAFGDRMRQQMASALNEGLPKGAHITAEEIALAGKDPNLREKLAKLMARRIRNKPYYKNKEQGFMEMSLAIRLGEMGIGAVTGGAMDEENRLRGAIVGALVAFTLGTVLRYGKRLGTRGSASTRLMPSLVKTEAEALETINTLHLEGRGVEMDLTYGRGKMWEGHDVPPPRVKSDIAPQAADVTMADATDLAGIPNSSVESIMFDPPFIATPGKGVMAERFGSFKHPRDLWNMYKRSLEEIGRVLKPNGKVIVKMQDTSWGGQKLPNVRAVQQFANEANLGYVDRVVSENVSKMPLGGRAAGGVQRTARSADVHYMVFNKPPSGRISSVEQILGNERGAWNMREMQERIVRQGEIEGPEAIRKPEHTRAETKARGARRELQKTMFGKAANTEMGRDGLRAWVSDTYGKTLSQMTEAEMVVADQDLTRRIALSKIFPEGQIDNAVKIRQVEDTAMELHGAKAQKKIDAAVRKVTGQHRDLQQLNEQDLTSVLEVLPKRFLRTRGLGALIRQPLAVEDVMNRMGSWGKYITRQVRRERQHTEYLWSKWYSPLKEEIRGLTGAEMDEVVAALHPMEANGRQVVTPSDPKLQEIALRIRQDLNEIGMAREGIGDPVRLASGGTRPFEMMDNYYPLHIPPEEMTSSILIKRRIIEHLMESGQAAGPSEALEIHQRFIQETISNRFGNLDYAREAWIEPEKFDLLKDLSRYYYGAAKRVSRHKYYGATRPGGELPQKMHDWLNGLRQDVGPDEFVFAQKAMKRHFKHEAVDDAMSDMLKRVRSFETMAHMGLAQIMNASEPVHTAVFTGFHNFAKGFARAIRGTSRMDAREIVARNASAVGSTIRDLFGEAGGAGSLTGKFLKISGFSPIEKWNRKLASHVGIQYIESTVAKLQRNPGSARLRRMLDEVLVNADDVLRHGLDDETLIKGAMELSNRTQKRTGVIDMPMFMSHPMGRIVAMFKTFAYGSARLFTRDFLLAAHRNPERLLRLLVAFPIVGEVVGDVRNLATGNIRDTEGLARLAENYAYVGTMGILYDFMRSVQFGEGSIQSFMTGPVGSDIAGIMAGTYQWLAEGKGRKIGKQALRMLPPPATLLRGKAGQKAILGKDLFPPPTKKWHIP